MSAVAYNIYSFLSIGAGRFLFLGAYNAYAFVLEVFSARRSKNQF
jgi:hypothetical protein